MDEVKEMKTRMVDLNRKDLGCLLALVSWTWGISRLLESESPWKKMRKAEKWKVAGKGAGEACGDEKRKEVKGSIQKDVESGAQVAQ
jgi:hypothetical protein